MSAPISDLIADEIVATLGGITVANGYQQTVTVAKVGSSAVPPADCQIQVSPWPAVLQSSSPASLDEYIMAVELTAFSIKADSSPDVSERLATLAADIHRRLMVDYHRSGRAINTLFHKPPNTNFQDGTGADWGDLFRPHGQPAHVIVIPRIWFRTLKNNPYQR